jgi:putative transposase
MSSGRRELVVGTEVWFEGSLWRVQRIDANGVELAAGRAAVRVTFDRLCSDASPIHEPAEQSKDEELVAIVLGSLTAQQREALDDRAAHVREVLAAVASGQKSARAAQREKAEQLGVSERTVERWIAGYRASGLAGIADSRLLRKRQSGVDPRWDAMCVRVLDELVTASTPTRNVVIDKINRNVEAEYGPGEVRIPSPSTANRRLAVLSKGRHAFGSAKNRRSIANRPSGVYGRLRATRPGEFVVLDTTPLDVFAMEPVTLRWLPVELTVAMDVFTRCIVGVQLTPLSTKARDVANVLYQAATPGIPAPDSVARWPFHGVPQNVIIEPPQSSTADDQMSGCPPETIVVDHGRQYLSEHVIGACARLGISIQPAIAKKPTDKPMVERFFRTLRQSLLQHLPAYKGPDVYSRGENVEREAFYYITELEHIIREWISSVYHHTKHNGLCMPSLPTERFSPIEMYEIGLARSGFLTLPARADLVYEFLKVDWRTIQHYGVEVNGQRYDGEALNGFRNQKSPYQGAHAGSWPIAVDASDVRFAYFRNPDTQKWSRLEWEHSHAIEMPFSQEAADYAKRISVRTNRHVNPSNAVHDLLGRWGRDEVLSRRDKALARRLSSHRVLDSPLAKDKLPSYDGDADTSLPAVIDLVARMTKASGLGDVIDDLDVFERYYEENPGEEAFEVFRE